MLVDTHCHIHEPSYSLSADEVILRARAAGVEKMICVGTNAVSSRQALEFASTRDGVVASIGVHPHDTKDGWSEIAQIAREVFLRSHHPHSPHGQELHAGIEQGPRRLVDLGLQTAHDSNESDALQYSSRSITTASKHLQPESEPTPGLDLTLGAKPFARGGNGSGDQVGVVAIGEIGLDYFYTHSPREVQIKALEEQLDIATSHNLPVIFHVREAFDDFWPVFDNFHGLRGVLHSYTDTKANMQQALKRELYIGVNGISTFTKDSAQRDMFASIPLERMLCETDAPFLTPAPFRGTINEPAYIRCIAEYHARERGLSLEEIAAVTTANACAVFAI